MRSMTKTRKDMDVTECIGVVYAETETELSRPIRPGAEYDENRIRQRHD